VRHFILDRREAIQVLRKVCKICIDIDLNVGSIALTSLTQNSGLTDYQLKIGFRINEACRAGLMPFLKEKGLEMKESEDSIVIFSGH
jgi:hypothetical protein